MPASSPYCSVSLTIGSKLGVICAWFKLDPVDNPSRVNWLSLILYAYNSLPNVVTASSKAVKNDPDCNSRST